MNSSLRLAEFSSKLVFLLGIIYVIVTTLGLISLNSSSQPITDPYFTIMELLTLIIALLMAISVSGFHSATSGSLKIYSFLACMFMYIMVAITSCVHFTVLVFSHQADLKIISEFRFLFSFQWPSVVYIMDVLAWDWFYTLSVISAAFALGSSPEERRLKWMLLASGIISLAGLTGAIVANMQLRNIGIVGYAVIGPVCFLYISKIIKKRRLIII